MNTEKTAERLLSALEKAIKGKKDVLRLFITAYLTGGHVLLEDVPGVGKTTLVKTFAALIEKDGQPARFRRIQCTPDLLPYDITGVEVFNAGLNTFEFMEGPVFADILLADELNRTPPKVQSALLEAMAERQGTRGCSGGRRAGFSGGVGRSVIYRVDDGHLNRLVFESLNHADHQMVSVVLPHDGHCKKESQTQCRNPCKTKRMNSIVDPHDASFPIVLSKVTCRKNRHLIHPHNPNSVKWPDR